MRMGKVNVGLISGFMNLVRGEWRMMAVCIAACRLGGVVVITSALHAEGPRFEPGPSQAPKGIL